MVLNRLSYLLLFSKSELQGPSEISTLTHAFGKGGWGKLYNYPTWLWFFKSSVFSTGITGDHLGFKTTHSPNFPLLLVSFVGSPSPSLPLHVAWPQGLLSPWPSLVYTHNWGNLTQLHRIKCHLRANSQFISTVSSFYWGDYLAAHLMPSFNYTI